jgi:hypothetical protein
MIGFRHFFHGEPLKLGMFFKKKLEKLLTNFS